MLVDTFTNTLVKKVLGKKCIPRFDIILIIFPHYEYVADVVVTLSSLWHQEEDLNCVRERWSEALIKRREYLDEQIKKIINKQGELNHKDRI